MHIVCTPLLSKYLLYLFYKGGAFPTLHFMMYHITFNQQSLITVSVNSFLVEGWQEALNFCFTCISARQLCLTTIKVWAREKQSANCPRHLQKLIKPTKIHTNETQLSVHMSASKTTPSNACGAHNKYLKKTKQISMQYLAG